MARLPIHWIEARTYRHATEDEARVETALAFAAPGVESAREVLEGHFGNVLVRLTRHIDDGKSIRAVWGRWSAAGLPQALDSDVDARGDEDGVLHFRLGKQAAFQARFGLTKHSAPTDLPLQMVAYPAKPEVAPRGARS